MRKKENVTEKVGKKDTYTEGIKRNIFIILIFFIIKRYRRSTKVIIIISKKKTIVKTVKLFMTMTLSYPTYCKIGRAHV